MPDSPTARWLSLLWSDSAFPAGGASHSSGLEGAVQCGYIRGTDDLAAWIHAHLLHVFGPCDLAACVLSHRAAGTADFEALFRIDERVNAMKLPREEREASLMLGQRRLKVTAASMRHPFLETAREYVATGGWNAHQACVFGLVGQAGGISEEDTAAGFTYHVLAGMSSAAIRMRICGQQAAQDIMTRLGPVVASVTAEARLARGEDDLRSCGPAAEAAQMRHERARVRLFMS